MRSDPGLRGLRQALDPARMMPFLARAAGLGPEELGGLRCAPEVITHKPGRRCVIRYGWSAPSVSPRASVPRPVFGKLYVSRRRATRMRDQSEALRRRGVPSIPASLMLVGPAHLVLQECVDGVDLGRLLGSDKIHEPLVLAARWLAKLHRTSPLPALKQVPDERSLVKARSWLAEIGQRLPAEAKALGDLAVALEAELAAVPGYGPVMIHRDYHHAHVLWDGVRIWVLDFDELSLGDPALDVGHFLARLQVEIHRRPEKTRTFAELGALFLRSYREVAVIDPRPRLAFSRAYTFLKLAHHEALTQGGAWQRPVRALVDRARRELSARAPRA